MGSSWKHSRVQILYISAYFGRRAYLEETESFDRVAFVKSEAVVDSSRDDEKIAGLDG